MYMHIYVHICTRGEWEMVKRGSRGVRKGPVIVRVGTKQLENKGKLTALIAVLSECQNLSRETKTTKIWFKGKKRVIVVLALVEPIVFFSFSFFH
uniref:Uncharacterized protein n=1 Tax=Octopus bimaculoides TaxID=37653 RepID=A0A0L8FPS6_OCTBM